MPMFYTPKPRQFHYQPRFYNPEKEKWEALKQLHADVRQKEQGSDNADLDYFMRRVREIDREEKPHGLTWRDMFRKREMPTFNYQPRFATSPETTAQSSDTASASAERMLDFKKRTSKIKRRFDIGDKDYMKPMSAGRIMLYALLVCMLVYWVVF